jgi:hypothetical protein
MVVNGRKKRKNTIFSLQNDVMDVGHSKDSDFGLDETLWLEHKRLNEIDNAEKVNHLKKLK